MPALMLMLVLSAPSGVTAVQAVDVMRPLLERYWVDRAAVLQFHDIALSRRRHDRLVEFHRSWLDRLRGISFDALRPDERIDYVLLRNHLEHELDELEFMRSERERLLPALPFAHAIVGLEESRRQLEPVAGREAAGTLDQIGRQIGSVRAELERAEPAAQSRPSAEAATRPVSLDPDAAWRAAASVADLRRVLERWHENLASYDPEFAWWTRVPYEAAMSALEDYARFLRTRIAKVSGDESDPLLGHPIGREMIARSLRKEMIPYAPEQLIGIASDHYAWCESEMKRAASEMGHGDDWKRALEVVKSQSVRPGGQAALVAEQAREAIEFCDRLDLVTIPPLCRETWRLEMISAQGQRSLPFASYGGQRMNVAYPTADMDHERKLMSMRGNNRHFSRLVTPHELIPGHHLQSFMAARERSWRRGFSTPFLVEGFAVYGEMLFYVHGFPKSPEDRIGALFWRMHRCARVVVSLRYHLGEMTPQAMVDWLVERVGHERDGATAEVRRYIGGSYGPLYQCGYLIGAIQIWKLREEMDAGGRVSERAFHDAILGEGPIPIELIRAALLREPPRADGEPRWRFAGEVR